MGELRESPNVKTRAIRSQTVEGKGSTEGSETRKVSPNNNPSHERPRPKRGYEIVRAAWKHAELWFKRLQDNKLQEHDDVMTFTGWGASANVYGAESLLLGRQACIVGVGGYRMQGMNNFLRWVEKKFSNGLLGQECSLNKDVNSGNTVVENEFCRFVPYRQS